MAEHAGSPSAHPATLLFDGDCGFCTTTARWAERHIAAPGTAVLPWQQANLDAFGLTPAECDESVKFATTDGAVFSGAAAAAAFLRERHGPWHWVGNALTLPVIRQLAAIVYRIVSANRHRLPGGTPACQTVRNEEH